MDKPKHRGVVTLPTPQEPKPPEAKRPTSGRRVREHMRNHRAGYVKLVGALTALATAVTGYLELEKSDKLVYKALTTKVNLMAEELASLKGQNELMLIFLQAKLGGEIVPAPKLKSAPKPHGPTSTGAGKAKMVPRLLQRLPAGAPTIKKPKIVEDAFQELPRDLDSLRAAQKAMKKSD